MTDERRDEVTGLGDQPTRELSSAESEAALRDAFEAAQHRVRHDGADLADRLRAIVKGYSDPDNQLLLRLAELLEQSSVLAHLAQEPVGHVEPIFVLRGQDLLAAMAVRYWAAQAAQYGRRIIDGRPTRLAGKLQGAYEIADAMDTLPGRRLPGE